MRIPATSEVAGTTLDVRTLARAQRGDRRAWAVIVDRLYSRVSAEIRRMLRPGHRDHADDLTQDVFLKLLGGLSRFDLRRAARFTGWVLTVTRNLCVDFLRRRRPLLDTDRSLGSLPGNGPSPVDSARHTEEAELVADALNEISPEQRQVLEMRYRDGLRFREIASLTGVSEPTLKSRVNRARARLRRRLAGIDPRSAA